MSGWMRGERGARRPKGNAINEDEGRVRGKIAGDDDKRWVEKRGSKKKKRMKRKMSMIV